MGNTLAPGASVFTKEALRQILQDCKDYEPVPDDSCVESCGRVFKTVPCLSLKDNNAKVALKIHYKREHPFLRNDVDYQAYQERLEMINEVVASLSLPSILPWRLVQDTPQYSVFVRQHLPDTLQTRVESAPPLSEIEQKWVLYQILHCLAQLHDVGACHGDLKPSNVLLSSWTWVLLTDIPFWKPSMLSAAFTRTYRLYYENIANDDCYIAPERLVAPSDPCPRCNPDGSIRPFMPSTHGGSPLCPHCPPTLPDLIQGILASPHPLAQQLATAPASPTPDTILGGADAKVTAPHDVFSVGALFYFLCTGNAPFSYPDLLLYARGDYYPDMSVLPLPSRIVCAHMMQRNASSRLSARAYLRILTRNGFFPPGFVALHQFLAGLLTQEGRVSADVKVGVVKRLFPKVLSRISQLDAAITGNSSENQNSGSNAVSGSKAPGIVMVQSKTDPTTETSAATTTTPLSPSTTHLLSLLAATLPPSSPLLALFTPLGVSVAPVAPSSPLALDWLLQHSYRDEFSEYAEDDGDEAQSVADAVTDAVAAMQSALKDPTVALQYDYESPSTPPPPPASSPSTSAAPSTPSPTLPLLLPLLTALLRSVSSPLLVTLTLEAISALAPSLPSAPLLHHALPALHALFTSVLPLHSSPPPPPPASLPLPPRARPRPTVEVSLSLTPASPSPPPPVTTTYAHVPLLIKPAHDEHATPLLPLPLPAPTLAAALRTLTHVLSHITLAPPSHRTLLSSTLLPTLLALYQAPTQTLLVRTSIIAALPAIVATHMRWCQRAHVREREECMLWAQQVRKWTQMGLEKYISDPTYMAVVAAADSAADTLEYSEDEKTFIDLVPAISTAASASSSASSLSPPPPRLATHAELALLQRFRRRFASQQASGLSLPQLLLAAHASCDADVTAMHIIVARAVRVICDQPHTATAAALLTHLPALLAHLPRAIVTTDVLPHLIGLLPASYAALTHTRQVTISQRGYRALTPSASPSPPSRAPAPARTVVAHTPLLTETPLFSHASSSPLHHHWHFRALYASRLPLLAAATGASATEDAIVPCLDQLLLDPSPSVLLTATYTLLRLLSAVLISPKAALTLLPRVLPLLLAPLPALRDAAVEVVVAVAHALGLARTAVYVAPLLAPVLLPHVMLVGMPVPHARGTHGNNVDGNGNTSGDSGTGTGSGNACAYTSSVPLPGCPPPSTPVPLHILTRATLRASLKPPLSPAAFDKMLAGVQLSILDVVVSTRAWRPVGKREIADAIACFQDTVNGGGSAASDGDVDAIMASDGDAHAATHSATHTPLPSSLLTNPDPDALYLLITPSDIALHALLTAFTTQLCGSHVPLVFDRPTVPFSHASIVRDATIDAYVHFCQAYSHAHTHARSADTALLPHMAPPPPHLPAATGCSCAVPCPAFACIPRDALAPHTTLLLPSPSSLIPAPIVDTEFLSRAAMGVLAGAPNNHFPSLLFALLNAINIPDVPLALPYIFAEAIFAHITLYGVTVAPERGPQQQQAEVPLVDTLSLLADMGVGVNAATTATTQHLTSPNPALASSAVLPLAAGGVSVGSVLDHFASFSLATAIGAPMLTHTPTDTRTSVVAKLNGYAPSTSTLSTSTSTSTSTLTSADLIPPGSLPLPPSAPDSPLLALQASLPPSLATDPTARSLLALAQWIVWAATTARSVGLHSRPSSIAAALRTLLSLHSRVAAVLFSHRPVNPSQMASPTRAAASTTSSPTSSLRVSAPVRILPPSAWPEHTARALRLLTPAPFPSPHAPSSPSPPAPASSPASPSPSPSTHPGGPSPTPTYPFPATDPSFLPSSPLFSPLSTHFRTCPPAITPRAPSPWPFSCDYDPYRHAMLTHDGPVPLLPHSTQPAPQPQPQVQGQAPSVTHAPTQAEPQPHTQTQAEPQQALPLASTTASPAQAPPLRPKVCIVPSADGISAPSLTPPGLSTVHRTAAATWLPRGACASDLTGHSAPISALALAADAQYAATACDDGVVRLYGLSRALGAASCPPSAQLQLAPDGLTALATVEAANVLLVGTSRGEGIVVDVSRLPGGSTHSSTYFSGSMETGDSETSPLYLRNTPTHATADSGPSRACDEAVLRRVTVPGSVVATHHLPALSHSVALLSAHDGSVYGYDLRMGQPVLALPSIPTSGYRRSADGGYIDGDVGALTAACLGPSEFSFLTGSSRGYVTTYDLRYSTPVSLWRVPSATPVTTLHAVNAASLFPLTRSGHILHSAANPLVVVSAGYTNEIAAYDIAQGICRTVLRAADPVKFDYRAVQSIDTPVDASIAAHTPSSTPLSAAAGASVIGDTSPSVLPGQSALMGAPASLASVVANSTAAPPPPRVSLLGPRNYSRYYSVNGGTDYSGYYTVPFHPHNPSYYGLGYPMSMVSCFDVMLQALAPRPWDMLAPSPSLLYHAASDPAALFRPSLATVPPPAMTCFAHCPGVHAITGGSDRTLRFWNLREPHKSFRISSGGAAAKLRYTTHGITTEWPCGEMTAMVAVQEHEDTAVGAGIGAGSTAHAHGITHMVVAEHPEYMLVTAGGTEAKVWL